MLMVCAACRRQNSGENTCAHQDGSTFNYISPVAAPHQCAGNRVSLCSL